MLHCRRREAAERFSLTRTFRELPWHVVPFLFGMFMLVEALDQGGWVAYFAQVRLGPTPVRNTWTLCCRTHAGKQVFAGVGTRIVSGRTHGTVGCGMLICSRATEI